MAIKTLTIACNVEEEMNDFENKLQEIQKFVLLGEKIGNIVNRTVPIEHALVDYIRESTEFHGTNHFVFQAFLKALNEVIERHHSELTEVAEKFNFKI